MKSFFISLLFFLSINIFATDELAIIQTISNTKKTFVIQKGLKEGVSKGQEIVFSNETVSINCKAVEVNREYSLWKPLNQEVLIPFKKNEIVNLNSHLGGSIGIDVISSSDVLMPKPTPEETLKRMRHLNSIALRFSYGGAISQNTSSISPEKNSTKVGYDVGADYNFKFHPTFEGLIGLRFDSEIYRTSQPELDIPTTRTLLLAGLTYHLSEFSDNSNNYYISLIGGIGKSSTTISGEVASGMALIIPQVRIGYLMTVSASSSLAIETSVESVSTKETFSDQTEQNADVINLKISGAWRF